MVPSPTLLSVIIGLGVLSVPSAFAQTIQVNETTPCFLNYTAGAQVWEDCGMGEDYLRASLIGFEWVTGGYFSLVLATILILFTYIKYHKAIYPILIGVSFIPITIFLLPDDWVNPVMILVALVLGIGIYKAVRHWTSDFN